MNTPTSYDASSEIDDVELAIQTVSGSLTPHIFANGHNRLAVEVIAKAKKSNDDGTFKLLHLSPDTWNRITSLYLPSLGEKLNYEGNNGWCFTNLANDYTAEVQDLQNPHPAAKIIPDTDSNRTVFYVYTTEAGPQNIAARIEVNDKHFTSVDNPLTTESGAFKNKNKIGVTAHPEKKYSVDDLHISKELKLGKTQSKLLYKKDKENLEQSFAEFSCNYSNYYISSLNFPIKNFTLLSDRSSDDDQKNKLVAYYLDKTDNSQHILFAHNTGQSETSTLGFSKCATDSEGKVFEFDLTQAVTYNQRKDSICFTKMSFYTQSDTFSAYDLLNKEKCIHFLYVTFHDIHGNKGEFTVSFDDEQKGLKLYGTEIKPFFNKDQLDLINNLFSHDILFNKDINNQPYFFPKTFYSIADNVFSVIGVFENVDPKKIARKILEIEKINQLVSNHFFNEKSLYQFISKMIASESIQDLTTIKGKIIEKIKAVANISEVNTLSPLEEKRVMRDLVFAVMPTLRSGYLNKVNKKLKNNLSIDVTSVEWGYHHAALLYLNMIGAGQAIAELSLDALTKLGILLESTALSGDKVSSMNLFLIPAIFSYVSSHKEKLEAIFVNKALQAQALIAYFEKNKQHMEDLNPITKLNNLVNQYRTRTQLAKEKLRENGLSESEVYVSTYKNFSSDSSIVKAFQALTPYSSEELNERLKKLPDINKVFDDYNKEIADKFRVIDELLIIKAWEALDTEHSSFIQNAKITQQDVFFADSYFSSAANFLGHGPLKVELHDYSVVFFAEKDKQKRLYYLKYENDAYQLNQIIYRLEGQNFRVRSGTINPTEPMDLNLTDADILKESSQPLTGLISNITSKHASILKDHLHAQGYEKTFIERHARDFIFGLIPFHDCVTNIRDGKTAPAILSCTLDGMFMLVPTAKAFGSTVAFPIKVSLVMAHHIFKLEIKQMLKMIGYKLGSRPSVYLVKEAVKLFLSNITLLDPGFELGYSLGRFTFLGVARGFNKLTHFASSNSEKKIAFLFRPQELLDQTFKNRSMEIPHTSATEELIVSGERIFEFKYKVEPTILNKGGPKTDLSEQVKEGAFDSDGHMSSSSSTISTPRSQITYERLLKSNEEKYRDPLAKWHREKIPSVEDADKSFEVCFSKGAISDAHTIAIIQELVKQYPDDKICVLHGIHGLPVGNNYKPTNVSGIKSYAPAQLVSSDGLAKTEDVIQRYLNSKNNIQLVNISETSTIDQLLENCQLKQVADKTLRANVHLVFSFCYSKNDQKLAEIFKMPISHVYDNNFDLGFSVVWNKKTKKVVVVRNDEVSKITSPSTGTGSSSNLQVFTSPKKPSTSPGSSPNLQVFTSPNRSRPLEDADILTNTPTHELDNESEITDGYTADGESESAQFSADTASEFAQFSEDAASESTADIAQQSEVKFRKSRSILPLQGPIFLAPLDPPIKSKPGNTNPLDPPLESKSDNTNPSQKSFLSRR